MTAAAGGSSISLNGGSLAAGASCSVAVTVTATTPGDYTNTSGAVSDVVAGSGNSTSDTLTVGTPHAAIGLQKLISTSATGPWFTFVTVPPGTPLYYRFTTENTGDVTLATFNVTDPALAGTGANPAGCVWETTNVPSTLPTLPVATATIDPTATCVVGPIVALSGDNANTATAHGVFGGGTVDSSPSIAQYLGVAPGFDLLKQIAISAGGPWSPAITVPAGTDVYYRFTLANTGALDLSEISVTDPQVSTASCTFTDPLIVGAATFCVVGPVTASGVGGSTTTNTAIGRGSNNGTTVDTLPSSASYTISAPTTDLAITKTDGVTTATPGASVTYTIVASNTGPSTVTGATVTDTLPASLTGATWTCVGAGGATCPASGFGNIAATVDLPVGASATFTLTATLSPAATGTLTNTATISTPAGLTDPTPGNNAATDTDTITPTADLAITKTDGVSGVSAGGGTTYTITVSNAGPSEVTNATVVDSAPVGLTFGAWTCAVSDPGSGGSVVTACGAASGSGNLSTMVTMKVGAVIVYTVPATVAAGATGSLANTVTVTPPPGMTDPNPANNSATDTDTVSAVADLSITKTSADGSVPQGGSTTYTITVSNAGPREVINATVSDIAPADLTFGGWSCAVSDPGSGGSVTTACGASSGSGNLNTTVTMKAGAVIVYTVSATVAGDATGSIANTATVTPPPGVSDPTPANNSGTSTLSISASTPVPVLDGWGLAVLVMLLCAVATHSMRLAKRR